MKKLASIVLVALFTVSTFAQHQQHQKDRKQRHNNDFTVDQQAELQTKKMTLQLDLNEQQQKQVLEINKAKIVDRKHKMEVRKTTKEADKKPTSDEIFKMKNARLDKMMASKAEMKKILTKDQFETWEKSRKRKGRHMKMKGKKRKMQQHRMKK